MKAIAYQTAGPISQDEALLNIELPVPVATGRDLLVEVKAVSVNPVDTKIRNAVSAQENQWKVLGWDATGVVKATGPDVTLFKPGDRVWYAGDISRQGSNAEFQLVDERIVGHMPSSLSFANAAALPLTSITAWEMLFDRLQLSREKSHAGQSLLIIGASGGVGSIMTQLARQLTDIHIIGTASRPETQDWVHDLGAHQVISHKNSIQSALTEIGIESVDYVVSLTHTDQHFSDIVNILAPQGRFGLIDDPAQLDVTQLKRKSVSLHWELMFTRALYETPDMQQQHHLLNQVATLIDQENIRSTANEHYGVINANNLIKAHRMIESGRTKGKIILEGF